MPLSTFCDLHNCQEKIYYLILFHNDVYMLSAYFCNIQPNQLTKDPCVFPYWLICLFLEKNKIVGAIFFSFVLSHCAYSSVIESLLKKQK